MHFTAVERISFQRIELSYLSFTILHQVLIIQYHLINIVTAIRFVLYKIKQLKYITTEENMVQLKQYM